MQDPKGLERQAPRGRIMFRDKPAYSPKYNRWTGKPHEGSREAARRLRQRGVEA